MVTSPRIVFVVAGTLALAACAGPRASSIHYSPPSAVPVRDKISSAQSHAAKAKADVARAKSAIGKLGIPPESAESASSLSSSLTEAEREIDALTAELLDSQSALKDYEKKVEDQTLVANHAIDDKNEAIRERELARDQDIIDRKHAHRLKLYICGALSVVAFLIAFQFRAILALLGPWGLVGGLAGLPAIAFAIAWKFF